MKEMEFFDRVRVCRNRIDEMIEQTGGLMARMKAADLMLVRMESILGRIAKDREVGMEANVTDLMNLLEELEGVLGIKEPETSRP